MGFLCLVFGDFLFYVCVLCVYIEIVHLNWELQREVKSTKFSIRFIEALFLRHTDICLVINHVNAMFEKFLFFNLVTVVSICIFIFYTCFIGYSVMTASVKFQFVIGCCTVVWQLITLTLSPSYVHEEVCMTLDQVHYRFYHALSLL